MKPEPRTSFNDIDAVVSGQYTSISRAEGVHFTGHEFEDHDNGTIWRQRGEVFRRDAEDYYGRGGAMNRRHRASEPQKDGSQSEMSRSTAMIKKEEQPYYPSDAPSEPSRSSLADAERLPKDRSRYSPVIQIEKDIDSFYASNELLKLKSSYLSCAIYAERSSNARIGIET